VAVLVHVRVAQEVDEVPVLLRELEPLVLRDGEGDVLVPLVDVDQVAVGVGLDGLAVDFVAHDVPPQALIDTRSLRGGAKF